VVRKSTVESQDERRIHHHIPQSTLRSIESMDEKRIEKIDSKTPRIFPGIGFLPPSPAVRRLDPCQRWTRCPQSSVDRCYLRRPLGDFGVQHDSTNPGEVTPTQP
jgi:hypothetical protein